MSPNFEQQPICEQTFYQTSRKLCPQVPIIILMGGVNILIQFKTLTISDWTAFLEEYEQSPKTERWIFTRLSSFYPWLLFTLSFLS